MPLVEIIYKALKYSSLLCTLFHAPATGTAQEVASLDDQLLEYQVINYYIIIILIYITLHAFGFSSLKI